MHFTKKSRPALRTEIKISVDEVASTPLSRLGQRTRKLTPTESQLDGEKAWDKLH
jgi:hypothetical protein